MSRKHLEKWAQNGWFLLHDNTPAHWSLVVIPCTLANTMLRLLNYFLFPQLKRVLKQQFMSAEEVTAKMTKAVREVLEDGFLECFQKLYEQ
jgi:hypothetical protein